MDFKIRSEEIIDIEQVRGIVRAAYPTDAESKLVDTLRTYGKAIISLVAVEGVDRVLGHILFSRVSTAPPNEAKGLGLAPIAVRRDVQSHGIGSALIREGLRHGKELGYDYCVVLGNPKYYQHFGFEKASCLGLKNEYGVDNEFMVIRFTFTEREVTLGLVRYVPQFALFFV